MMQRRGEHRRGSPRRGCRSRGRSTRSTITAPTDEPGEHDRAAEQQAVLEPVAGAHAVEPAVALAHEVGRVGVRADAERHDLGADDRQQRAGDQRVDVPLAAEDAELGDARSTRRSPPIAAITAPGRMNRWLGECTSRKRRWRQPSRKLDSFDSPPRGWYSIGNCADLELLLGRADHHLGGELHPGRAQVQPRQHVAAERAHPAVGVVDAGAEQEVEEAARAAGCRCSGEATASRRDGCSSSGCR